MFSVTRLTKIKRQEKTSALVKNILKMSKEIITPIDFTDNTMQLFSKEIFVTSN
jgi:hypothetical protein